MGRTRIGKLLAMGVIGGGRPVSPLLTSLVSYWKLDELTGTRNDSHGANHLAVTGTVGSEAGKLGNAALFGAGTNTLTQAGALSITAAGATVWGWLKLPETLTDRSVLLASAGPAADISWYLCNFGAHNSWRFLVNDSTSGASIGTNTTAVTHSTWVFLCGRYNPATKKAECRVNASAWALGNALTNGPRDTAGASKRINTAPGLGPHPFSADSVGFAQRYFSDAEVDQLYNAGGGLEYPF